MNHYRTNYGKNICINIVVILLGLAIVSCMPRQNQEPKIRIVDLQGKSRSVVTRMPILNNKALMMQRVEANKNQVAPQNNASYANQGQPINKLNYGEASSQIIQKTLQPTQDAPQGQNPKGQNPIVAIKDKGADSSIEYDLSDTPEVAEAPVQKKRKKKFIISNQKRKGLFVQVGAFSNASNAKKSLTRMQKFHNGRIEKVAGKKVVYRVLLGPFSSKKQANALVKKIKKSGHDAVLMRNR